MLVSILIPSLFERQEKASKLVQGLYNQIKDNKLEDLVEVICITDNRTVKLSDKRNMLQKLSSGKYFMALDDDDEITNDYCKTVIDHIQYLESLDKEYDVIGYNQLAKVQGKRFIVRPSLHCDLNLSQQCPQDPPVFARFPWQWCLWHEKYKKVYRTDSDTNAREDQNWLKKVQLEYPKTMSTIDKVLHIYNFDDPSESTCQ